MAEHTIAGIDGDPLVYLNGEMTPISQAKVSVMDRGFIYGDGIYEAVPVYKGKPFRTEQHLTRLFRGLSKISIDNPYTKEEWTALIHKMIESHGPHDQLIYMQVTRGPAKRDHAFPAGVKPTIFAMAMPISFPDEKTRTQGIDVVSAKDERWLHCDIKSISLLGNVLARQIAVDAGAQETILFRDGSLTEGAAANVWVVRDGKLLGSPKDNLVLEGIRYGLMDSLCQEAGVALELRRISEEEVRTADELILSSATKEVIPITKLDGKPVGKDGKPGPVYAKLRAAYDAAIARLK
jgi:D-alanine transaminase